MLGGNLRSQSLRSSWRRLGVEEASTRARARQQQPGKTGWRSGPTAQPQPTNTGRELMGTQHLARRTRHQFGLGVGVPYGQKSYKVDFAVSYLASYGGPWVPRTRAASYRIRGRAAAGTLCLSPSQCASASAGRPGFPAPRSPLAGATRLRTQSRPSRRSSPSSQAFPPQPGRESCCDKQPVLSLVSSGQMK